MSKTGQSTLRGVVKTGNDTMGNRVSGIKWWWWVYNLLNVLNHPECHTLRAYFMYVNHVPIIKEKTGR